MGRIALAIGFLAGLIGGIVYLTTLMSGSGASAGNNSVASLAVAPDYVDPACLWPVLDAALLPDAQPAPDKVPVRGCAPAGALSHDEDGWARVALEGNLPDGDQAPRRTGARIAFTDGDANIVIETYDNWGGSGVFSALVMGARTADGAQLTSLRGHAFGDRCNGGLASTRIAADGQLRVLANMTPWDILVSPLGSLEDEAQWQAAEERLGVAFGETPACAMCCSAVTREYAVDVVAGTLREVGLRYDAAFTPGMQSSLLVACLEHAVQVAAGEDGLVAGSEAASFEQSVAACVDVANLRNGAR